MLAAPSVVVVKPVAPTPPYRPQEPAPVDGWELVVDAKLGSEAVAAFEKEAEEYPAAGLPRVGLSLAHATLGNGAKAVWAMRKALFYESASLSKVPLDNVMRERIRTLIVQFRDGLDKNPDTVADAWFMLAALDYIQGEYARAHVAIENSIKAGSKEPTTHTLDQMIEVQLAMNFKYDYK